ncbi:balbiani ring protein 3-like [Bacillus rossius redtenbacheri]|uniref:balbiani ring protein 3-like n=1 Tax=Bacillus rossius redtenbacheri TaxID=93214 RepID=UPI002FDD5DE4
MFASRWQVIGCALAALFAAAAAAEHAGRCPALAVCPGPLAACDGDDDCGGQHKCCASPCGRTCVRPLFTGCEQVQAEAGRRARALGPQGAGARVPRCDSAGDFEQVQCSADGSKCWCVDAAGFELPGTRAPGRDLANCSDPRPCSAATCRMLCPHGFALAEDGCPKCQCYDPCSEVKCPKATQCQLEDVACFRQPCPPVPKCKKGRSLENVCPAGSPLTITDSNRPFLCGTSPGRPNCPPLFRCLVQPGHDYGVCCPASFELQKPGSCPPTGEDDACGLSCEHDLECASMQKCCESPGCGKHCTQPQNVTVCLQQKMLSELLVMSEKEGKGYVPQCSATTGQFEPRQCSRNGLVCWCVDSNGNKLPGSMGSRDAVRCSGVQEARARGRSSSTLCDTNLCAQVCEYGFKADASGCPTCECDDPCEGFRCGAGERCVVVKDSSCTDFLCPTVPVCQAYRCQAGLPLVDDVTGDTVMCDSELDDCPGGYTCAKGLCCPREEIREIEKPGRCPALTPESCVFPKDVCEKDEDCPGDSKCCSSSHCGVGCYDPVEEPRLPTMCEYLRDFSTKMEGTRKGMQLALPPPTCHANGSFEATQCVTTLETKECWCVDGYGTEIPNTRGNGSVDCPVLRRELGCLDQTCRLGCDYGFLLDPATRCPLCECRGPCEGVACPDGGECLVVEVNCEEGYCPPVPACLPKKIGQCPYLIPVTSGSCDYECKSDINCNGTAKCCSNGCGTQCVEPVVMTACQHQRTILQHRAHEMGTPAGRLYIPQCRESDGGYEPVQCHPRSRQCWCVDEKGEEVSGTRAPPDVQPSCHAPSECPLYKCSTNCQHGYKMDARGCRTCECRDPCEEMPCRGEGEACRLVEVACVDRPCPPVPLCLPRRDNPCPGGHPLLRPGSGDAVRCGPAQDSCPSSHKCHLSPLGEFAVCCPKPRDVCFEPRDEGPCNASTTRWFFNTEKNKCDMFVFGGCAGNQNNFESEQICNTVCPVLSQCERLRERNQKAAERYKKATFVPRCDPESGRWLPVQCLDHVGVCWCSDPEGEPVKGSLTRDALPVCNFRQARRRMDDLGDSALAFEELLKQVSTLDDEEDNRVERRTRCQALRQLMTSTNSLYAVECDAHGRFAPTQCYPRSSDKFPECWCVDEAGNQLPNTTTFRKGAKICLPVPIEAVQVKLGFNNYHNKSAIQQIEAEMKKMIFDLGAKLKDDIIQIEIYPDIIYVHFDIIGANKVDVAYYLEEMVKSNKVTLSAGPDIEIPIVADITKSRFSHRLPAGPGAAADRVIALEHREVVSESTLSEVKPYQTAVVLLCAGSAFVICVLVLVIALYRRKMSSAPFGGKAAGLGERFVDRAAPVYVVSLPKDADAPGGGGGLPAFDGFQSREPEDSVPKV